MNSPVASKQAGQAQGIADAALLTEVLFALTNQVEKGGQGEFVAHALFDHLGQDCGDMLETQLDQQLAGVIQVGFRAHEEILPACSTQAT
jgi:hypothetical protein